LGAKNPCQLELKSSSWQEPLHFVQGDTLTISVAYGPIDATFKGKFSKDGRSFSGGWRPNPGADETINVPYDIAGTRVE
jgi:hypothetical protein